MIKTKYWTKLILESFLEESGLNKRVELGDERARLLSGIITTRFAGWSVARQAEEFHISVDTVNKYIKELQELYDVAQKSSIILPIRKTSRKETIQDTINI